MHIISQKTNFWYLVPKNKNTSTYSFLTTLAPTLLNAKVLLLCIKDCVIVMNVCPRRVRARTQIPCHHKRCIEHWLCKDVHSAKWVPMTMKSEYEVWATPLCCSSTQTLIPCWNTWQWSLCLIRDLTSYPLDAMCKNFELIFHLF